MPEKLIRAKYPEAVNSKGELKKYYPAREYLKKTHKRNLGKPLYRNTMENYMLFGPRGWGKSYIIGNLSGYEFLFDGILDYDEYLLKDKSKKKNKTRTNVIVSAADSKYTNGTISKTQLTLDNLPGSLEVDGHFFPSPLAKQYEGSFSKQITAKYRQKVGGNWQTKGSGSTIKNRTFKDNPFAVQGERSKLQVWDEIGFFNNLREAYAASVDTRQVSGVKVGSFFFTGTGGDLGGSGGLDAQYMFYHPNEFDLLTFKDTYENQGYIATFLPAWFTNESFKDDNGWLISVDEAKDYYIKQRQKLMGSGGDSLTLDNFIVYHPIVPSEVFLAQKGAYLPTTEIQNRITKVRAEHIDETLAKRVELYFDPESDTGVSYKLDTEKKLQPVNEFPWNKDNREGCVVLYELPIFDEKGKIPEDLYIIGHDPYRSDNPDGSSLASIYVLKTKKYFSKYGHDEIVAQYVGRPYQGRKIVNEILLKLSMFYGNARIYFENNVGNVKEYFEKRGRLDLLAKKPHTILSKKASLSVKDPYSPSVEYGYSISNDKTKLEAINYIRDWMLEKHHETEKRVIRNLDLIPDLAFLQEALAFNMDANFDRVMGFAGCVLGMEEIYNQYEEGALENRKKVDLSFLSTNKNLFPNEHVFPKIPEATAPIFKKSG